MVNLSPARRSIAAAAAALAVCGVTLSITSPVAASVPQVGPPTVELSGTPTVGVTTEATVTYSEGASADGVTWGYLLDDSCVPSGARSTEYKPVPSDVGKTICLIVGSKGATPQDVRVDTFTDFGTYQPGELSLPRVIRTTTETPYEREAVTASAPVDDAPAGFATTWAWGWWNPAVETCEYWLDVRAMKATFVPTATEVHKQLCVLATFSAPGYTTESRERRFESAVMPARQAAERPRVTVSDTSIRKGQKVTVRAYGMTPGQSYLISIKGRKYTGKADESGRVVQVISYPATTKSSKKRYVRVKGWMGSTITFNQSVKVTYKR